MSPFNPSNLIIGTCGHIDHGKTALIKALSGVEGDITPEEKKRGITIDLSFVHIQSAGRTISFIDVPGHESLVKNMVAGAYGFDYAMLIVAANEGLMPQSFEHLRILELLGIKNLILVISKSDLVEDARPISKAIAVEINERFNFQLVETFAVSVFAPESIELLRKYLDTLPKMEKKPLPFFRLYIDRVFMIRGSGTVVTGTVSGGSLQSGTRLRVCEIGKMVTVKSIQKYGESSESAQTGERVALNLASIEHQQLQKGMLLASKGYMRGFRSIDVWVESESELHNKHCFLHLGAKRIETKVLMLEGNLATLQCGEAVFSVFGERFVLRDDRHTLGGGEVLNPIADPIKKRQKIALLQALKVRDYAQAFYRLVQIHKKGFGIISALQRFGIPQEEAIGILSGIEGVFVDSKDLVAFPKSSVETLREKVVQIFEKNRYAMLSARSLKERFNYAGEAFCQHVLDGLEESGIITCANGLYVSVDCDIGNLDQYLEDSILSALHEGGVTPLAPYNIYDSLDIDRQSGDKALKKLTKAKKAIRLEHNFFIEASHLQQAIQTLRQIIQVSGYVDVALCKERMGVSRKYAIALLEHLDQFGDINKEGHKRLLST